MKTTTRTTFGSMLVILICAALATPAAAQIELRFEPRDPTVFIDHAGRLAIRLDDVQDVRSFEVTIQYDPEIVTTIAGSPGQVFLETGCNLFEGLEEDTPGSWHGYVVILGAECWATGPGELFTWDFTATTIGETDIVVQSVALYAPQIGVLPDVTLMDTTVTVTEDTSPVPDALAGAIDLRVYPNPFNPRAIVAFDVPRSQSMSLLIYDVLGRRVTTLFENHVLAPGHHDWTWDGRDGAGRPVAVGVYLCHLTGDGISETARAVLTR